MRDRGLVLPSRMMGGAARRLLFRDAPREACGASLFLRFLAAVLMDCTCPLQPVQPLLRRGLHRHGLPAALLKSLISSGNPCRLALTGVQASVGHSYAVLRQQPKNNGKWMGAGRSSAVPRPLDPPVHRQCIITSTMQTVGCARHRRRPLLPPTLRDHHRPSFDGITTAGTGTGGWTASRAAGWVAVPNWRESGLRSGPAALRHRRGCEGRGSEGCLVRGGDVLRVGHRHVLVPQPRARCRSRSLRTRSLSGLDGALSAR